MTYPTGAYSCLDCKRVLAPVCALTPNETLIYTWGGHQAGASPYHAATRETAANLPGYARYLIVPVEVTP